MEPFCHASLQHPSYSLWLIEGYVSVFEQYAVASEVCVQEDALLVRPLLQFFSENVLFLFRFFGPFHHF